MGIAEERSACRTSLAGLPRCLNTSHYGPALTVLASESKVSRVEIIRWDYPSGQNDTFNALLSYQDCSSEDERLWGALNTIECCVHLAPWIITHLQLSRMTAHGNFSVRSAAASICMDLAHSAPGRMPLDLAMKLSVYNEDWYVQAPANAALKAMVRTTPEVLRIFHLRLRSGLAQGEGWDQILDCFDAERERRYGENRNQSPPTSWHPA